MALFDAASARAQALCDRIDVAEQYLARAAPQLLWMGSYDVLDVAAADLAAARERAPTTTVG